MFIINDLDPLPLTDYEAMCDDCLSANRLIALDTPHGYLCERCFENLDPTETAKGETSLALAHRVGEICVGLAIAILTALMMLAPFLMDSGEVAGWMK